MLSYCLEFSEINITKVSATYSENENIIFFGDTNVVYIYGDEVPSTAENYAVPVKDFGRPYPAVSSYTRV